MTRSVGSLFNIYWKLPGWADAVALIVAGGVFSALVVPSIATDSAYFDEGYSAYLAQLPILQAAYYTSLDVHPPLYYALLHGWQLVWGDSMTALRLMSLLWALIAIVLAFLVARQAFGRRAAWTVLLCLIVSPLLIRYGEAARMYTMALALILAATYVLQRLQATTARRVRWRLWTAYAVIMAAGMWTNYFTALVWVSHAAWLLYESCASKKSLRRARLPKGWYAAMATAVILYLPWLPMLIGRYQDIQQNGFWIAPVSSSTLPSTLTISTIFRSAGETSGWLTLLVLVWAVLTIWLFIKTYRQLTNTSRSTFRLLLACGLGPIILLFVLSLPPLRPAYTYRYVLSSVIALSILLGASLAISRFKHHSISKRLGLSAVVIGTIVIGTTQVLQEGNRNLDTGAKSLVAQTITAIDQIDPAHSPIITYSPYTFYAAFTYEAANHPIYYPVTDSLRTSGVTRGLYDMPDRRGIKDVTSFLKAYPSVWILSEDKNNVSTPPEYGWKTGRTLIQRDPKTGTPSAYATEYRAY